MIIICKDNEKMSEFKEGLKSGIPIGLGYLSVSTGFGIFAVPGALKEDLVFTSSDQGAWVRRGGWTLTI